MATRHDDPEAHTAPGLAVPSSQAEGLRRALREAGLLATGSVPRHHADRVLFPLSPDAADTAAFSRIRDRFPDAEPIDTWFPARHIRRTDYRERLDNLPDDLRAELPRAHDVVGPVAILKLPEALHPHRESIAQALLATYPQLATVALDHGVIGEERVRDLEVVAGEPRLNPVHKEHGLRLQVELDRVYFSPRLATERMRLLERIQSGQRVLDLFAGIGAFVCLVARDRNPAALTAIDRNPHAVRLLKKNLEMNKIPHERVTVIEGDAREKTPRTGDWDHVVMNLPHDAHRFLDAAAKAVAPQGEIHLYAILEREDEPRYLSNALATLERETGVPWNLAERRHVRPYAPTMDGLGFTLRRE